jgi:hypothetical protein
VRPQLGEDRLAHLCGELRAADVLGDGPDRPTVTAIDLGQRLMALAADSGDQASSPSPACSWRTTRHLRQPRAFTAVRCGIPPLAREQVTDPPPQVIPHVTRRRGSAAMLGG